MNTTTRMSGPGCKIIEEHAVEITAEMVHKLRDESGYPLMACKYALTAMNGDMAAAKEYLRHPPTDADRILALEKRVAELERRLSLRALG